VTFYRVLTGRWPFPGRSVPDVFQAIRERTPAPMRGHGDGSVSRRLEAIVRKCLAKDPVDRFASMAELGGAVDRFLRARSWFVLRRRPGMCRVGGSEDQQ
jgi:serine/threonine-protein kinase